MTFAKQSKSSLFLMEIVLAILFFSLASAVCMQLFTKAHIISSRGNDISTAVNYAQSVAECFKESDGDLESIKRLLGGETTQNTLTICYDEDWKVSDESNAPYRMRVSVSKDEITIQADIILEEVPSEGEPLYSLIVKEAL